MRCEELMTTEVEIVKPEDSIQEAAQRMRDSNVGFLPVCADDGTAVGVLTDRDIAIRVVADDRPWRTPVRDVMSSDVVSCRPEDDVKRAEDLMRVNQKSRLPCIDEAGRVVGVISLADVAQYEAPRRTGELLGEISDREVIGAR